MLYETAGHEVAADILNDIIEADKRQRVRRRMTLNSVAQRREAKIRNDDLLLDAARKYRTRHLDASVRQIASALLPVFGLPDGVGSTCDLSTGERDRAIDALAQRIRRAEKPTSPKKVLRQPR